MYQNTHLLFLIVMKFYYELGPVCLSWPSVSALVFVQRECTYVSHDNWLEKLSVFMYNRSRIQNIGSISHMNVLISFYSIL